MSLQHFVIPLRVAEEVVRASLVLDDTGTRGTIKLGGKPVCDFELETAWSVPNYFIAERLTRIHILDILGIEAEPIDTGYTPA